MFGFFSTGLSFVGRPISTNIYIMALGMVPDSVDCFYDEVQQELTTKMLAAPKLAYLLSAGESRLGNMQDPEQTHLDEALGKLIRTMTISGGYNTYLGVGCFEGLVFTTETITGSESVLEHGTKFRCGASGASKGENHVVLISKISDFGNESGDKKCAIRFLIENVALRVGTGSEESGVDLVGTQIRVTESPSFFSPDIVHCLAGFPVNSAVTQATWDRLSVEICLLSAERRMFNTAFDISAADLKSWERARQAERSGLGDTELSTP
ncbi:hypothetical protein B0H14DRAFT_3127063 [Mycena olivaceomarginata]|nr:hypothetical protein B0H14DRAFT_3127063 [Mycena olivaceomarginata]